MTTALTTAPGTAPTTALGTAAPAAAADTTADAPTRRPGRERADTRPAARIPWLSPVPDCEPPFDDELTGPSRIHSLFGGGVGTGPTTRRSAVAAGVTGTSAPARPAAPAPGAVPPPATGERGDRGGGVRPAVVTAGRVPGWSRERDVGVEMTSSASLPRADRTGRMLAQALLEVLAGARPLAQLREHCAPDVFAGMEDQRMLRGSRPPRLLTTRVGLPADGAAEVAAVFRSAERVRAMAFRLQGIDGRWRITQLQIG